jgi:hypothetical protein
MHSILRQQVSLLDPGANLVQNVQFARAQLTRLEHNALGIKAHVRRQEIQADLNRKRELLELIVDRLNDLSQVGPLCLSPKNAQF